MYIELKKVEVDVLYDGKFYSISSGFFNSLCKSINLNLDSVSFYYKEDDVLKIFLNNGHCLSVKNPSDINCFFKAIKKISTKK